jgi:hypothetical protein
MSSASQGSRLVLEPADEYTHPPGELSNYNESMYFSLFDSELKMGAWYRIGNRPNEGYAELSNCIYLDDGRVAFMAGRPAISDNDEMNAGGLHFAIEEPFKRIRATYDGKVCVLKDPREMADPNAAFKRNPIVPCRLDIVHTEATAPYGGLPVNADGTEVAVDPKKSFAKAHYEQFMAGTGTIQIGQQRWKLSGHGMRDKSWGPRYWQSIAWYRWVHAYFGPDLALGIAIMAEGADSAQASGWIVHGGTCLPVEDARIESSYDLNGYQTRLKILARTLDQEYAIDGRVRALLPLRNRRRLRDGTPLVTRICEGMTEYVCEGRTALGMSEYLDQIVDGRPVGIDSA